MRALQLRTLVRMGATERVEQALAELAEKEQETGEMRATLAALRLAQGDPRAAALALGPVIDGSAPVTHRASLSEALLLEATARDALGDSGAAGRALERALDIAEPDGAVLIIAGPILNQKHPIADPMYWSNSWAGGLLIALAAVGLAAVALRRPARR